MEFAEYPLLNTPHLVLVVLKTASSDGAKLEDAVLRLRTAVRRAGEEVPFDDETLRSRLHTIGQYLAEANLVDIGEDGGLRITGRGRRAIAEHPAGFDTADLVGDVEMRRRIARQRRDAAREDPRNSHYEDGYAAHLQGARITENPFLQDSIDHLAWEDGWCEARDDGVTGKGGRESNRYDPRVS